MDHLMTKSGYFVIPFWGAKKAAPLREDAARRKNLQLKRSDVSRHGEKSNFNYLFKSALFR